VDPIENSRSVGFIYGAVAQQRSEQIRHNIITVNVSLALEFVKIYVKSHVLHLLDRVLVLIRASYFVCIRFLV
jgi:hypothetical protein